MLMDMEKKNIIEQRISDLGETIIEKEELIRAKALIGPHRDDINFYINGNDAVSFASQGQQRTVVLALKLAEINIIERKTFQKPILLLDDVAIYYHNNRLKQF